MIKIKKTPKGAPFWRWYLNLGVGECEVECLFCYNKRWDWSKNPWKLHELDIKKLEQSFSDFKWDPGKCKQYEGHHDIMMCSVGDPFASQNRDATSTILALAAKYPEVGDHLRVLSKLDGFNEVLGIAGTPPDVSARYPSKNTMFGATICTLDKEIKKKTMPNSASLDDVFGSYLYTVHNQGNPLFIISEPMLKGMDLCNLMEELNENEIHALNELWIGHLNYGFGCEEYAMSDEDIIKQVRLLKDSYELKVYVKREVKGVINLQEEGIIAREGSIYDIQDERRKKAI